MNEKSLLQQRYLQPGEETFADLARRVADWVEIKEVYEAIKSKCFIPSRMPYMGTEFPFSSSCFVLGPIEDDLASIMNTLRDATLVQKMGGGCIGGESVVITDQGPMPIKQLVARKDPDIKVLSYNPDSKTMEYSTVTKWHTVDTEPKRVYKINFSHGNGHGVQASMTVSDWHPFFVFDGEQVIQVRADDLEPGMVIIGSSEYRHEYDEWGWALGYIAGDGAIDYSKKEKYPRVRICDDSEEAVSRVAKIMGVPYSRSKDKRFQVDMWECASYSDVAGRIRDSFGGYKTCYDKCIPEEVWSSSPSCRFSFIVGHLDADGWYNEGKSRFQASTVSKKLAFGLMALAGSLGIRTKVRFRESRHENEQPIWEVRYMTTQSFIESVMDCSAKYNDIKPPCQVMGSLQLSMTWRKGLSSNGIELGTQAWRARTPLLGREQSLINWLQNGIATRDVAGDIIEACNEPELAQSVRACQIVHSVEQEDGDILYDLTVPSNQTYLASPPGTGAFVVVHNTGYSFSRLRPEGDLIRKSGGEASGPVSFMRLYHEAMTVVKRAGKKHAAQMGILNVSHPDIVKFVRCKEEEGRLSTFNISVAVSDDFMEAVRNDSDWDLTFGGKVYDTIPAKELYHLIAEHAWRNGEPGVIFIDEINRQNPFPVPIEACNACGEKPLPYNCSCNLASINLSKFVDDNGIIDWNGIEEHTRLGVRFLDVAIDRAWWPLEEVERNTKKYRNIGLGVMGWADMLIKMRIPYDSDTAVALASGLMAFINDVAHDESQGRNTTLTSIAPTGSISMLAGCSPSIEPLFGLVTNKQTNLGLSQEIHSEFKKRAEELGIASEALWADVSAQQSVQHLDIPQGDKEIFKTAMEIPWERHLMMQAAFQESVDSAVSKTINLENSATIQDVKDAIMLAEALGCKSLTLYRDGSRSEQVYVRTCPDCEAELVSESGCWSCPDCGYSLCSL